ncbi:hypothetical protein BJY04DRAFT_224751 [Aspergillus karnatakaensis]|uniref:uncharacterized protein n=1 Tax=Aspergillus karnatakaensis TaxID=1810916 RepID=UPI003CCD490B
MAHISHPNHARDFEIAFLCVLKVERHAIELALDEEYEPDGMLYTQSACDTNAYTLGRMGNHHVVIVYLPQAGNIGSAAAAASVTTTFTGIKLAIVVGVCGVSPHARDYENQEVLLGDVIVSTTVLRTSSGHQYPDKFILGKEEDTLRLAPVAIRTFLCKLEGILATRRLRQRVARYTESITGQGLQQGANPGPALDKLYVSYYRHKHHHEEHCSVCTAPDEVCQGALRSPCVALGCDDAYLVPRPRLDLARGFLPDGTVVEDDESVRNASNPLIIFGKFASGEAVIKSGLHRDELVRAHNVVGFEMEGAGSWGYLPTLIVKGACDYADSHKNKIWQQYAAVTAAAGAKAIVEEWRSGLVHEQPEILDEIKKIPRVMDACFDAHKLQDIRTCLSHTRVSTIEKIRQWATRRHAEPVFWLQGIAGSGKTTVAKTVAEIISKEGNLGASFFFSRQGGDRANASKFFGTVAYQLAVRLVPFRSLLTRVLESNPDIFGKAYMEQWEHLILRPLQQLGQRSNGSQGKPLVVVVDAIDECAPVSDIGLILGLLIQVKGLTTIPLRFLLTGRPEESMHYGFRRITPDIDGLILHQIDSNMVNADIRRFIKHEFDIIQERYRGVVWYTECQLDAIVAKSDGLFVYAATLSRSLSRSRSPNHALIRFLERDSSSLSHLNEMYNLILEASIPKGLGEEFEDMAIEVFSIVIGSLAILFDTLSINALHRLLEYDSASYYQPLDPDNIEATVISLGSVLDIPYIGDLVDRDYPIRIFHPSFREFLLVEQEPSKGHLHLGTSALHERLLNGCLFVMTGCLQKNMCLLSVPDTNPTTLSIDLVRKYIPPDVQYACKYWTHHAEMVSEQALDMVLADDGPVYQFLKRKVVYWFEALGLLQIVPHAVTSITRIKAFAETHAQAKTKELIQDTYRFLVAKRAIIADAPLQLYCSALLFSPLSSPIRVLFGKDIMPWLLRPPEIPTSWPLSVAFKSRGDGPSCVAFSPDAKTLAAGYDDGSIEFWEIATGFLHRSIQGPSHDARCIAYALDGALLRILHKQERPGLITGSQVVVSHDGQLILTGLEQAFIWESDPTVLRHSLIGHSKCVDCLSFSPDSRSAITGSGDSKVRIYNCTTGALQHILDIHQSAITSLTLDVAGDLLATTDRVIICLWDLRTLRVVKSSKVDTGTFHVALSHDGKLLVANRDFVDLEVWDVTTWTICRTLRDHSSVVSDIKLSSDSRLLASASSGDTLRLWDLNDLVHQEWSPAHKRPVLGVSFSPCGTMLASCSMDSTVRVYEMETGRSICVLKEGGSLFTGVGFTSDGSLLVVAGSSSIQVVNTHDWSSHRILGEYQGEYSWSMAFSPGSNLLAAGYGSRIEIWITTSWQKAYVLEAECHQNQHGYSTSGVLGLSPDGRILACGSFSDLYIFDLQEPSRPTVLHSLFNRALISYISFSPDGTRLVCRSDQGDTKSWVYLSSPAPNKKDWIHESSGRNFLITPKMFSEGPAARWAIEGQWIQYLGQGILYLPEDRRVQCCDIFDNTIAIGSDSGIITILQFRDLDRYIMATVDRD